MKAALKVFGQFPEPVQARLIAALRIAAHGEKADTAKPMKGLGAGVFESQGNTYRAIYALQLDEDIWVIHAFQKKSKTGIKTPQQETDLICDRIKRLKEQLQ